ncbi:hypothetical protein BDZ88DRAFT_410946 [Geranomyces variabilis]|nr:hypothetical protein BDZ88DRAFT_410946 [Geranomyces variabilis]KAJ3137964.1 hypothetical protein HDU90_001439 [Geranomyces variabilis]
MTSRSTELTNAYVAVTLPKDVSLRHYLAFMAARLPRKELYKASLNDWTSRLCNGVIKAGQPLKDFGTADEFVEDRKTFHYATIIGERQDSAILLHSLAVTAEQDFITPDIVQLLSSRVSESQQSTTVCSSMVSLSQQEESNLVSDARQRLDVALRDDTPPPVELGGVHCGRLLHKIQQVLYKSHASLEESDYVAAAATFSTLLIPPTAPSLYRSYLPDNNAWRQIRNCLSIRELPQLHEDESSLAVDLVELVSEMVELKRAEKFWYPVAPAGPVSDQMVTMLRRIFDALNEECPEDKHETTWISRVIAPLFGMSFSPDITVQYDFPSAASNARPGITITCEEHILLVGEIIAPNGTRAALGEEMTRLIQRGSEALKATVKARDFNGKNPSLFVLRIDGVQAAVYELNMAKRMFYLHNIGNIMLPTTLSSDSIDCIAVAVFRIAALLRRLHRLKEAAGHSVSDLHMSASSGGN